MMSPSSEMTAAEPFSPISRLSRKWDTASISISIPTTPASAVLAGSVTGVATVMPGRLAEKKT